MKGEHPPKEIAELPRGDSAEQDGIGEEDNKIPTWFNAAFIGTIVFAFVYMIYYTATGWSARGQYQAEMAAATSAAQAAQASQPTTNPYHRNAAAIADGKVVFEQICAACHKPDGSGLVGPSLIDPYWKYGHTDEDLFKTVMYGRPGGMPAWGTQLGSDKVWRVLAYVETLPKSNVPGLGAPGYQAPGAPASPPPSG
ncbi:MAG TPA: c-type cytochrome [Myxococcota bacterium]|nr:c-type cytochrome [Myxococcota bacterium]